MSSTSLNEITVNYFKIDDRTVSFMFCFHRTQYCLVLSWRVEAFRPLLNSFVSPFHSIRLWKPHCGETVYIPHFYNSISPLNILLHSIRNCTKSQRLLSEHKFEWTYTFQIFAISLRPDELRILFEVLECQTHHLKFLEIELLFLLPRAVRWCSELLEGHIVNKIKISTRQNNA